MTNRVYFRSAGAVALGAALLAAALLAGAAPSSAQGDEGRSYRRGDRPQSPPSERAQPAPSGGGEKWRRGDERGSRDGGTRGGGSYGGGSYGSGEKYRRDELEHRRGSGGHGYGDRYRGRGHGDRHWYDGGWRYSPPRPRYWHRPRHSVRIQLGLPYYYPHYSHRRYVVRRPVVREYLPQIEVENYAPSGCYYWDPHCDREWDNLDEYTEHLDGADHDETLEIVDESSGEWVRTLVYRDGYWSVRR